MTDEEKEFLEPVIRSIMEKGKGNVTDADVAKAMELLNTMADNAEPIYHYEHPDYGAMVKEVPQTLGQLLDNSEEHSGLISFDDMMDACSKMERGTLVDAVDSLIYFWLDKWHGVNDEADEDEGVWLHPMHLAILMAERFALRECLPALLEIERQDRDFAEAFFDECDMVGMPAACIYQIATEDDLPLLTDFVRERGIHTFSKAEVIAILLAMGWDEDHLHQFVGKRRECYATSMNQPDSPFAQSVKDGSRYVISHLLQKAGDKTLFEYDYGDGWSHEVKLTAKSGYADGEKPAVRLTGGANACPPDDCGGIWRYNRLVWLMQQKPDSHDLREFYDWLGSKWDTGFFPLKEAARAVDAMNK